MNKRRYFLDGGPGESRGVVTLEGKPERLIIARDGDAAVQALGAHVCGRVRSIARSQAVAFIELGAGPDAVLNLTPGIGPVVEGGWVEVEVKSQARGEKGSVVRHLGSGVGPVRLLAEGLSVEQRMRSLAGDATVETGEAARAVADHAQDEALETVFPLAAGGSIAVETTRALTAVDVDIGARTGQGAKRVARETNMAALAEAARVLRLKGLGGLVVIDLVGHGHDSTALMAAARTAFAADNPGVAFAGVSRFGLMELTIPRRARPVVDILCDTGGVPSATTLALSLVRALEREAAADGGGRLEVFTSPEVAEASGPAMAMLIERIGDRVSISSAPGRVGFEIDHR